MNQDFGDFEDDPMFDHTCRCGPGRIIRCDYRGCRCTRCGGLEPLFEHWKAPVVTELTPYDGSIIRKWIWEADQRKEKSDDVDRAQPSAPD